MRVGKNQDIYMKSEHNCCEPSYKCTFMNHTKKIKRIGIFLPRNMTWKFYMKTAQFSHWVFTHFGKINKKTANILYAHFIRFFGSLEWSAQFSVLILMTIMIQEDWIIIFQSFWVLEEDWKIIFQSSWGSQKDWKMIFQSSWIMMGIRIST